MNIALIENIEQLKQAVNAIAVKNTPKYGDFRVIAQMRFLARNAEGARTECILGVGISETGRIDCGAQFVSECTIETVKSAFTKNYYAKTATLIRKLQITPKIVFRLWIFSQDVLPPEKGRNVTAVTSTDRSEYPCLSRKENRWHNSTIYYDARDALLILLCLAAAALSCLYGDIGGVLFGR